MFKKILAAGIVVSAVTLAYFASKKVDAGKIGELKEKLPKFESDKIRDLLKQKDEIEDRISQLATRIADTAKDILDRSTEIATEKKEALMELIEDAKKAIQEEKERLKEIRARLDNPEDNEVI